MRMLKEAIGSGEQGMLEVSGRAPEMDWAKGLRNIGEAGIEHLKGRWAELSAPIEEGEMSPEALRDLVMNFGPGGLAGIAKNVALKALAKDARPLLQMAKGMADPMIEAQMRTAVSKSMKQTAALPQSTLDRVRTVGYKDLGPETSGKQQAAWPGEKEASEIFFNPMSARGSTPWHEIGVHARQAEPGAAMIRYRGMEIPEQQAAEYMNEISWLLKGKGSREQYQKEWYGKDPTETMAYAMEKKLIELGPEAYEELYPKLMARSLEAFEQKYPQEAQQAYFKFMERGAK